MSTMEKNLLLKLDYSGSGSFLATAGLRIRRLSFNAAALDITDAASAGRWRDLLASGGLKRASVSGSGIFKDQTADAKIRELFFAGAVRNWQLVIPDFGTIEGPFQITGLEFAADHAGEVTFDMSLESAGTLSFTSEGARRPIPAEGQAVAGWIVNLRYGPDRWSGDMFANVLPSDKDGYRIVRALYEHPAPSPGALERAAKAIEDLGAFKTDVDGYRVAVSEPVPIDPAVAAAAIRSLPIAEAGTPEDFVLVPVEPTEAMVAAGWDQHPGSAGGDEISRAYRAMIDARPAPPAKGE